MEPTTIQLKGRIPELTELKQKAQELIDAISELEKGEIVLTV